MQEPFLSTQSVDRQLSLTSGDQQISGKRLEGLPPHLAQPFITAQLAWLNNYNEFEQFEKVIVFFFHYWKQL